MLAVWAGYHTNDLIRLSICKMKIPGWPTPSRREADISLETNGDWDNMAATNTPLLLHPSRLRDFFCCPTIAEKILYALITSERLETQLGHPDPGVQTDAGGITSFCFNGR